MAPTLLQPLEGSWCSYPRAWDTMEKTYACHGRNAALCNRLIHAETLAWATGEDMRVAVLTNPDVLYLAMYDLYGQMFSTFHKSFGERVFQHMLGNYPVIAFDEFHLYSANQIANADFIMGT